MILRDRCRTSYHLASLLRGMRSTLDRWNGKIAKRIVTRPSALHSTFHFWRKSRRIEISANPLQAVWNEPGNRDLYRAMLTAADLTHAACDCPKNFSAQFVLAAIKKVMAEFKIKHSVPRSTWGFAWKLARAGFSQMVLILGAFGFRWRKSSLAAKPAAGLTPSG